MVTIASRQPRLLGRAPPSRRVPPSRMMANIIPPSEGVRTERWKYFRYLESQPVIEELYDLVNDPGEERNLVADPKHAKTLAELRARWRKLSSQLK